MDPTTLLANTLSPGAFFFFFCGRGGEGRGRGMGEEEWVA